MFALGFRGVPSKGDGCLGRSVWAESGCWLGGLATFLKVIWHWISSPAKTVWSAQRMKTRMLPGASGDMIGVRVRPAEGAGERVVEPTTVGTRPA